MDWLDFLAGDGERRIGWPCRDQQVLPRANRPQHLQLATRSRPAASPALPLVPDLSITRRPRPRTLSRHRPVPLPGKSNSLPFLISLHVLGTALTFLGGRAAPPRPDQRAVQADAAEPETRLLGGVSVFQGSTPRCTPPTALRMRTPGLGGAGPRVAPLRLRGRLVPGSVSVAK